MIDYILKKGVYYMDNLENVREKIRTINPDFSDQLLDLLCEYIIQKFTKELKNSIEK